MTSLDQMTPEQLRTLAAQLMAKVDTMGRKIHRDETIIEQLTHEIAILKRHKFAKRSEQISLAQGSLLDDLLTTDLEAIEAELNARRPEPAATEPCQQPKRAPLPPQFPRTLIHHEPNNTQCACGCQLQQIGEDVSEKLDYTPGVFTVEQHARGKWACRQCETLIQAPVPAQVIDKGIPTAGLLAHVMVAKFADRLAAVPTGKDLRPCRLGYPAVDDGAVGGSNRRAASATGRCAARDATNLLPHRWAPV
jgi:transposase